MKLEYKLTHKPTDEAFKTLKDSADAMTNVMLIAAGYMFSSKLTRAWVWIAARIRYRTVKQVGSEWHVTYTFPLC